MLEGQEQVSPGPPGLRRQRLFLVRTEWADHPAGVVVPSVERSRNSDRHHSLSTVVPSRSAGGIVRMETRLFFPAIVGDLGDIQDDAVGTVGETCGRPGKAIARKCQL